MKRQQQHVMKQKMHVFIQSTIGCTWMWKSNLQEMCVCQFEHKKQSIPTSKRNSKIASFTCHWFAVQMSNCLTTTMHVEKTKLEKLKTFDPEIWCHFKKTWMSPITASKKIDCMNKCKTWKGFHCRLLNQILAPARLCFQNHICSWPRTNKTEHAEDVKWNKWKNNDHTIVLQEKGIAIVWVNPFHQHNGREIDNLLEESENLDFAFWNWRKTSHPSSLCVLHLHSTCPPVSSWCNVQWLCLLHWGAIQ